MNERPFGKLVASWLRWNAGLIIAQIVALILLGTIASPFTAAGERMWSVYSLIYDPGVSIVEAVTSTSFTFDGTPGLALVLFAVYAVGPAFAVAIWRHPIRAEP